MTYAPWVWKRPIAAGAFPPARQKDWKTASITLLCAVFALVRQNHATLPAPGRKRWTLQKSTVKAIQFEISPGCARPPACPAMNGHLPTLCHASGKIIGSKPLHSPQSGNMRCERFQTAHDRSRGQRQFCFAVLRNGSNAQGIAIQPWWICRNPNDSRIKASEKCRNEIQSRRIKQQTSLTALRHRLQQPCDHPRLGIQLAKSQSGLL